MTMSTTDAQAFFECASKSFNQLKAIFVALESEHAKGRLSHHAEHLVGAGRHIAEGMAETVGCWADEAAEPWLDDHIKQPSEPVVADSNFINDLLNELSGIKAMIDAAERATWQEGCIADARDLVLDATFLMRDASSKISRLMEKT